MKFKTYGEKTKDKCPSEQIEMASFFNRLRNEYPITFGKIAIHVRNEGKRSFGQVNRARFEGGFIKGASDILIPGAPSFVCEMKSRSHTARLSPEQIEYLEAAQKLGAFVCVALGAVAAWEAFEEWKGKHYD